ncbi:MAG: Eco57I restriction-modification methylase domain-containing protein [Promethearchaeota archaeon]
MEPSEFHLIVKSLKHYFSSTQITSQADERKFGRYFTPKSVCRFINHRVLNHHGKIDFSEGKIPTIVDPSAGLGYFLVDIFFLLMKIEFEEKNTITCLKAILTAIFGFEVDEQTREQGYSLFLSIIGLILLIQSCSCDFLTCRSIIRENFMLQDFLKAEIHFTPQIVVGNPPYIRVHKMDPTYNSYLRSRFFSAKYDFDIYVCFFEKCIKILDKGGFLGFITPEKYLLRKYGGKLRLIMLQNCIPLEFVDISRCTDVFEVFTYPLITILRKSTRGLETSVLSSLEHMKRINKFNPQDRIHFVRTSQFSIPDQNLILKLLKFPQDYSDSLPNTIQWKVFSNRTYNSFLLNEGNCFNFILDPIVDELEAHFQNFSRFGDADLLIFSGTPRSKYYHRVKENIFEDKNDQQTALKFIMSKNVTAFWIFWNLPVGFDHKEYHYPQYNLKESVFSPTLITNFQTSPKLILKANSRNLTAAIDHEGYSFMGAYGLIWKSIFLNLEVICTIINSDLMNYYITKKYQSYMVNSRFLSINSIMVKNIPLPGSMDSVTGKFKPTISQKKFEELIAAITRIVQNLESHFRTISSKQTQTDQIHLKQILYESQLNTKNNEQNGETGEKTPIHSQIEELNELVFKLYDIPKIIYQSMHQREGSI